MIRTALVGLGDIGVGAHLPALVRHPEVEVAVLADPDDGRRAQAARLAPGARVVADVDAVLADPDVRAVVLATPPWVTTELAVRVARTGRYVLAEKPVATSTDTARAYDTLNADETARVQVGLTYRHDPAIERLAGWVRDGTLGGPLLVRAHVYDETRDPATPEHTERIVRTLTHGMPVVHEGAHVFDWLATMLGTDPPRLHDAWSTRTDGDLPAPNLVGARLGYGDHVALVEFGWLTDALPRTEVSVLGSHGYAVLDGSTFALELTTRDGREPVTFPGERVTRCFDRQVARFADLVTGRRDRPEPDLAAGRAALAISEQVATAAGGGR